jgi:predicted transcriptional regulator
MRKFKKRGRASYFVLPNEVMELYRTRKISAVDVAVFAALFSLRREYDGVRVSQERLALMCGITPKTVSVSVHRLYLCGLIRNVITETQSHWKKYKTTVYWLKALTDSGYFFVPRVIFQHTRITPKMYAVYFFMCQSRHVEYGKSWNSYGDICRKLGFGSSQRSEVMRLIGSHVERGLIKKTVRKIKGLYVDNIYRICGFEGVSATSGVGCRFTDINNTQKGIYRNCKSEKKISGLQEWRKSAKTAGCNDFYVNSTSENKIIDGNSKLNLLVFEGG